MEETLFLDIVAAIKNSKNIIPMAKKITFPKGFLWGASTSAHQVEGGTTNQWTQWEQENAEHLTEDAAKKWQPWQQQRFPEMFTKENYVSGRACEHYRQYEKDFDLAAKLGHNAHRFSIEWSRIEPEEGKFDEKEIEHYRKVIKALKKRGIEPFVCLWHWTNPLWLEEKGGALSNAFPRYFSRYAERMVEEYRGLVTHWLTINEPMSVIGSCYLSGVWPPQKKNPLLALKAYRTLSGAHRQAYDTIHAGDADAQVGFAHIVSFFETPNKKSPLDAIAVKIAKYFGNEMFLNMTREKNDFLALQYYFHRTISLFGKKTFPKTMRVNDLGWEIHQKGLLELLRWMKAYHLPIYITENGIADAGDEKRESFIKDGLKFVHKAISEGVDVRGYFYWSLLDNFEWDKGFWPRFGLIAVDYKTQKRTIRPSALQYAKICKSNMLEIDN